MLTKLLILATAGLAIVEAKIFYKVPWMIQGASASSINSGSPSAVQTPAVSSSATVPVAPGIGGWPWAPAGFASWHDWEVSTFWTTNADQIVTPTGAGGCSVRLWRNDCNICTCRTDYTKCTRIDCSTLPATVRTSNGLPDVSLPAWPGNSDLADIGRVYRFGAGFAVRTSASGSYIFS